MLPFFIEHYSAICQKIVIYDNQSTDNSVKIAQKHSHVEVREFDTGGKLSERALLEIKNFAWKEESSDYVIVCDIDEFLYARDFNAFFETWAGYDVFKPVGFNMYSRSFPTDPTQQIVAQVKRGWYAPGFSKMVLFRPGRIRDINYGPGAHSASPVAEDTLKIFDSANHGAPLKLLHYKGLGEDWLLTRNAALAERLSDENKAKGWGFQYLLPASYYRRKVALMRLLSYNCVDHERHLWYRVTKPLIDRKLQSKSQH